MITATGFWGVRLCWNRHLLERLILQSDRAGFHHSPLQVPASWRIVILWFYLRFHGRQNNCTGSGLLQMEGWNLRILGAISGVSLRWYFHTCYCRFRPRLRKLHLLSLLSFVVCLAQSICWFYRGGRSAGWFDSSMRPLSFVLALVIFLRWSIRSHLFLQKSQILHSCQLLRNFHNLVGVLLGKPVCRMVWKHL